MMNNFEKMMETMMEQYMEKAMANMMEKMFSTMMGTPTEAPAEVATPKPQTMSLEDFLALEVDDEKPVKISEKAPLNFIVEDFLPRGGRKYRKGLKYNGYLSKSVWTYNHLEIKKKYPNVKYSNGHYYAETTGDLQNFASSYHIVEKLNDEQYKVVKEYWDSRKK